ncbi:hypothetical protein [Segatella oris]|uniref:hypothetical protein n=1 Tax=Segatella oris TaxID=28135 RepID=UPI0015857730|nr:hypothetical protein [Segatella oris]
MKARKQQTRKAIAHHPVPYHFFARIDRFVYSTQDTYHYMSRFLYYFSVYVNPFKERFF